MINRSRYPQIKVGDAAPVAGLTLVDLNGNATDMQELLALDVAVGKLSATMTRGAAHGRGSPSRLHLAGVGQPGPGHLGSLGHGVHPRSLRAMIRARSSSVNRIASFTLPAWNALR